MSKVEQTKKWRHRNPEKTRIYNQKAYAKNREKILAINKLWIENNSDRYKEYQKIWSQNKRKLQRIQVFEKLGYKCVRCGFEDIRALCIDHINGGGVKELRKLTATQYLTKVLEDTTNSYQILCHNCNWIKRAENNETRKSLKI